MRQKQQHEVGKGKDPAQPATQATFARGLRVLFRRGIFVFGAILVFGVGPATGQTPGTAPADQATRAIVIAAESKTSFQVLKGKWLRPDGGYVIDITAIDDSGKMQAAYLNPGPINVSKAQATQDGSVTKVFIELRDTGYPGSTYTLTYDPRNDRLQGIYFQAAMQQSFDVYFVRMK